MAGRQLKLISCLGRISRDIYEFTDEEKKQHCFFNMGAMGSTLPLGLGLAIACPDKKFVVIEGDGSIIMNLGGLVTFKRYNPGNLTLVIIDNKQYETTGGQASQPEGFDFTATCKGIGLRTKMISSQQVLEAGLVEIEKGNCAFDVMIVNALPDPVAPRITESPAELAAKFKKHLTNL